LVVRLPVKVMFNGGTLTDAAQKALPNLLQLAQASHAAAEVWVGEDGAGTALLKKRLQAVAAVAPGASLGVELGGDLRVVYRPDGAAPAQGNLGRVPALAAQAGGDVHGQSK
jgi:hypothetical protein